MSEAAAAMGRKDADRWLAKAVIDIVAAEAANRAAEAGQGRPPAGSRPPRRRRRPARRGARQWASPPPQPPAPAPAEAGQPVHPAYLPPPAAGRGLDAASGPAGRRAGTPPGRSAARAPDQLSARSPGQFPSRPGAAGSALDRQAPAARPAQPSPAAQPRRPSRSTASPRWGLPGRPLPCRARVRARDVTGRRGHSGGGEEDTRDGAGDANRTGAARGTRAGAFRRHRRRRHVRHRPDHAGPGCAASPAATRRRLGRAGRAGGARGPGLHVGHAAGHLGDADTLVVSSAIRATTRSWSRRTAGACGWCTGPPRSASLMFGRRVIAVTGTHGKTSTTSMIATVLIETSGRRGPRLRDRRRARGHRRRRGRRRRRLTSWPRRTRATARS